MDTVRTVAADFSQGALKEFFMRMKKKNKVRSRDFPGGTVVKNLSANAGYMGSSPGPGISHMPQSN